VACCQQPTPEITSAGGDADAGRGRGDAPGSKLRGPDDQGDVPGPLGPGRAILIRELRQSYIAEPGAFGIRPGAGGGDPAALRRANPPGAGARADASVAAGGVIGVEFFPKRRRLAAGSSFGMCQE
jgi:hypothetical protein